MSGAFRMASLRVRSLCGSVWRSAAPPLAPANPGRRLASSAKDQWWKDRTFRFFSRDSEQGGAILSYEIVGAFQMNQYLLGCAETGRAALIDVGDAKALHPIAEQHGLAELKRQPNFADVPIHLHPADLPWYQAASMQSRMFGLPLDQPPDPEEELTDGQIIKVGHVPLRVIHTPGHCPGHVCLYCEVHSFLIAGDLLFAGSVGRTDFPMSDPGQMRESLRRIMELPDHTKVFPGHMQPTTIGTERRHNPFLR